MINSGSNAVGFLALGALFSAVGLAQTGAIDTGARKDIDAGNQAWVRGMKEARAAPIAATYAESAVDCAATGECVKGRAAIEDHIKARFARLGRAISASATSLGSVQQGDFVYEWGRSEVSFANGQKWPTGISPYGSANQVAPGRSSAICRFRMTHRDDRG
jgi:ketosteroid isomerase-like protein